jgi:membrane-anchored mycosin MYCP
MPGMVGSKARIAAAAGCFAAVVLVPAGPAAAVEDCKDAQAQPIASSVPYTQQLYDTARLAPLATGAGIRVAVIDSGVDATHPQLNGSGVVDRGKDYLRGADNAREDCNGHGTEVAGIIAARPVAGTPFQGLAPEVTIVPVRVTEQQESGDGVKVGDTASLDKLADAITWAANPNGGDAQVINLSLTTITDWPAVRSAVAGAVAGGVVIVAATGNDGQEKDKNPTPYPAAYPDVIGVGAITSNGLHADYSGYGDFVDLVAPGQNITAAARRGGHTVVNGTSAATPFVAATAALILQRFPRSTPAEVTRRLVATADPAPGGQRSKEYGYGVLDPYRAITETIPGGPPPSPQAAQAHPVDPQLVALAARREQGEHRALIFAVIGGGGALLVVLGFSILRRGRRRGWRPATMDDR